jgi:hypothetical protein
MLSALKPIPVAARSKAWICGYSFAGIIGSNPAGALMFVSCVCFVCLQGKFSATGCLLVQRSSTVCGLSNEYDLGAT